jgi:hypothetical protein
MNSLSYYTCVPTRELKEHCVKGVYAHPQLDATIIATPMPALPFLLEKQIFEFKFPNHSLHPGLVVSPRPKPKDEIY